ncbi:MAG: hypothetical protein WDN28_02690 [Chthoniobacter sp.]
MTSTNGSVLGSARFKGERPNDSHLARNDESSSTPTQRKSAGSSLGCSDVVNGIFQQRSGIRRNDSANTSRRSQPVGAMMYAPRLASPDARSPGLIGIPSDPPPGGAVGRRRDGREKNFFVVLQKARRFVPGGEPIHPEQHIGRRRTILAELGDLLWLCDQMMSEVIGAPGIIRARIADGTQDVKAVAGDGQDAIAKNDTAGVGSG